ncbi:unnamed protein product [Phaedon cochleariae]|uniref:DUF7869 domain-containing protein n=1 Tax=Phaedon cochleariae TaxID=80249 RepID=A0A9N9SD34_PHACE|nr:unnamed protein product [Phaedon cochleariae]
MDKNASPAVSDELQLHHRKAEKAQTILKGDCAFYQQSGSDTCIITVDLGKVLFVPTLTHYDMYYMRQLSVYNFSVHIADTNEAFMCVWNETEASRGSYEIMSCLLKVLNSNVTEKEKLNIWCDNCTGQNKNREAIFLMLFSTSIGLFTEITMKILVSGHSYLPNDRYFAQIDRRRRLEKCFVPEDIEQLIRDTRSIRPYKVVKMKPRHFLNLQRAADSLISTTKLSISTLSQIRVTKDNPGYVFFKKSHSDIEDWQKIKVLKKNISGDQIKNVQIFGQESTPELNEAKKQNLRAMIPYLHSPEHREFYQKLTE